MVNYADLGGSQGGNNLEILEGYNQSFLTLRGGQFFLPWGRGDQTPCLQGGCVPPQFNVV